MTKMVENFSARGLGLHPGLHKSFSSVALAKSLQFSEAQASLL